MAANTSPIFVDTPKIHSGTVSVANTARDGTGTVVTVATGSTDGLRIDKISIRAQVTTTAGMIRFFIYDTTNYRFWKEVPVSEITVGANTEAFNYELVSLWPGVPLLVLPTGYTLVASTHNAEAHDIICHGAEY